MEYVYAALLLHKLEQSVNEENVKKVMTAAGAKVDDARVKALVSALDGVNINEVVEKAAMPVAAPAPAAQVKEENKEEKKEEKKAAEEAVTGLGALFG